MTKKKATKKTKQSRKKASKPKEEMELLLEMERSIFIVETRGGKVVSKEPLDSSIVLQLLSNRIEEAIKWHCNEEESKA